MVPKPINKDNNFAPPYQTPLSNLDDSDLKSTNNNSLVIEQQQQHTIPSQSAIIVPMVSSISNKSNQSVDKNHNKRNKMNLQYVCCVTILVIFCINLAGLEIWNIWRVSKLQTEMAELHQKFNSLQENFTQLENSDISDGKANKPLLSDQNYDDQDDDSEYNYDDDDDDYDEDNAAKKDSIPILSDNKKLFDYPEGDQLLEDELISNNNDTVKRIRSVSPDEEIIPIMTDSNADQPNKPVEAHLSKLLFSRNENNAPQVHNDGMSRQNKYPKKFEAETSDYIKTKTNDLSQITTTAGAKRHHRHQHGDQKHSSLSDNNKTNSHDRAMKMSSSLFSSDTALPINLMRTISPNRPYIDGNQYHQHSSQAMDTLHSSLLSEGASKSTNFNQPKPRRRVLRPFHANPATRAVRSPMHQQNRFKTIAIHYIGDTSHYESGSRNNHHGRYSGNGLIRHPGGIYSDWLQSNWGNLNGMERYFTINQGVVTIKEHGLYYIYAQIFYHDGHDMNGYVIEHNSEPLFQCTTSTHSNQHVTKSNTCHTSGINYMSVGDTIRVKDLGSERHTLFDAAKSFFGLIKLGDVRSGTTMLAP